MLGSIKAIIEYLVKKVIKPATKIQNQIILIFP
jgi:hypothetical protein